MLVAPVHAVLLGAAHYQNTSGAPLPSRHPARSAFPRRSPGAFPPGSRTTSRHAESPARWYTGLGAGARHRLHHRLPVQHIEDARRGRTERQNLVALRLQVSAQLAPDEAGAAGDDLPSRSNERRRPASSSSSSCTSASTISSDQLLEAGPGRPAELPCGLSRRRRAGSRPPRAGSSEGRSPRTAPSRARQWSKAIWQNSRGCVPRRCHHVVAGAVLLKHHPHRLDVLGGITPVPEGIQVAQDTAFPAARP